MAVIARGDMTTHELHGVRFTGLVSPSTGASELMAWQTEVPPGTPPTPHQVTREELLVVLAGEATVQLGGTTSSVGEGDVVVVPPDTDFSVECSGDGPLRLLAVMPVSGQARLAGQATTLPWMT